MKSCGDHLWVRWQGPSLEVMAGAPLEANARVSGDRARLVVPGSVVFWLGSEVITRLLVVRMGSRE